MSSDVYPEARLDWEVFEVDPRRRSMMAHTVARIDHELQSSGPGSPNNYSSLQTFQLKRVKVGGTGNFWDSAQSHAPAGAALRNPVCVPGTLEQEFILHRALAGWSQTEFRRT